MFGRSIADMSDTSQSFALGPMTELIRVCRSIVGAKLFKELETLCFSTLFLLKQEWQQWTWSPLARR